MTTVTKTYLDQVLQPKLTEEEYRIVLKMFETQYAFEKSFMIVNNWRNEHLKICPLLNKKIKEKPKKSQYRHHHVDARTGVMMSTCGKHCHHNEKSWNG